MGYDYDQDVFRMEPELGKWKLTRGTQAIRYFDTKAAAIEEGRKWAHAERPCQLVIRDGTIEVETIN